MADPLSILIGGSSQAHQQREAEIAQASAQQNTPSPTQVPTQAQPTQPPPSMNSAGMPTFMASAATAPPPAANRGNTLLGQG